MLIISPSVEVLSCGNALDLCKLVEMAGRTCYKSETKITENSSRAFVEQLVKNRHGSVLEHAAGISVKFICDRGVSHEIVRHRLFSFSQESTRYVNYNANITFIEPIFWNCDKYSKQYATWFNAMHEAEKAYIALLAQGAKPEEARTVLPNSLKTEIIVTGNARIWRHFFELRTREKAHPQMREVALMALKSLREYIPVLFDNLEDDN